MANAVTAAIVAKSAMTEKCIFNSLFILSFIKRNDRRKG